MPSRREHIVGFDPDSFFRKIRRGKSVTQYPKATVIYAQGATSDAVYFLQTGQVKLTVCSSKGREAIITMLGPSDFFGEGCLVGQDTRTATAMAVRDCVVIRIEKATMARLLRDEPKLSEAFLSCLLTREMSIEEGLVDQMLHSTEKRLARALLSLAGVANGWGSSSIIPRVTHETLGQMIGATRAQVSSLMSRFRRAGYIDYQGEVVVNKSLYDFFFKD
jgi:CRP/FNR family transcriptional regulator, cyclic AMP receptor protein